MFYLLLLADAYKVMTNGLLRQAMYRLVYPKQADRQEGNRSYNNPVALAVCAFDLDFVAPS